MGVVLRNLVCAMRDREFSQLKDTMRDLLPICTTFLDRLCRTRTSLEFRKALNKIAMSFYPRDPKSALHTRILTEGISHDDVSRILTELSDCPVKRGYFSRMIKSAPLSLEEAQRSYDETIRKEMLACTAKRLTVPNWVEGLRGCTGSRIGPDTHSCWGHGATFLDAWYHSLVSRLSKGTHSPKLSKHSVSKSTSEIVSPQRDELCTGITLEHHRLENDWELPLPDKALSTNMETRPKFYPNQIDNRNYYVCGYRETLDASIIGRVVDKTMNDFEFLDPKTRLITEGWLFSEDEYLSIWDLSAFTSRLGTIVDLMDCITARLKNEKITMTYFDCKGLHEVEAHKMWSAYVDTHRQKLVEISTHYDGVLPKEFRTEQGGLLGIRGNLSMSAVAHAAIALAALGHTGLCIVGDDGRARTHNDEQDTRLLSYLNTYIGDLATDKMSGRKIGDKVCLKRGLLRMQSSIGFSYQSIKVTPFPHCEEPLTSAEFDPRYFWLRARSTERDRSKKMSSALITFFEDLSSRWDTTSLQSKQLAERYAMYCYKRWKLPVQGWIPQVYGGFHGLTPILSRIGSNPQDALVMTCSNEWVDLPQESDPLVDEVPLAEDQLRVGCSFYRRSSQQLSYLKTMGYVEVTPIFRKERRFVEYSVGRFDRLHERLSSSKSKHSLRVRVRVLRPLPTDCVDTL